MSFKTLIKESNRLAEEFRKLPKSTPYSYPNIDWDKEVERVMFVVSPSFLRSKEWISLRKRVIKHYGGICMKCGCKPKRPNVDHIRPRRKFPSLALRFENCQVLCGRCNKEKGNTVGDWRQSYFDVRTKLEKELDERFKFSFM